MVRNVPTASALGEQSEGIAAVCPVCGGDAGFMANHPEATLYRCHSCTHAFSILAPSAKTNYDDAYYTAEHKRWFEHPNYWVFAKIEAALSSAARSVPRVMISTRRSSTT